MLAFDLLQEVFLETIAKHLDDMKNRYRVHQR